MKKKITPQQVALAKQAGVWIALVGVSFALGFFGVKALQSQQDPTPTQQEGPRDIQFEAAEEGDGSETP
jgi:hypothetical protein